MSDLAPKAYVIGADQVLAFGNEIMSKPDSMETARRQLLDLSGKTHTLHTVGRGRDERRDHLGDDRDRDPHYAQALAASSSAAILPLPARRC